MDFLHVLNVCPPSHFLLSHQCQRNAINKLKSMDLWQKSNIPLRHNCENDSTRLARSETMDIRLSVCESLRVSYKVNNKVIGVCGAVYEKSFFSSIIQKSPPDKGQTIVPLTSNPLVSAASRFTRAKLIWKFDILCGLNKWEHLAWNEQWEFLLLKIVELENKLKFWGLYENWVTTQGVGNWYIKEYKFLKILYTSLPPPGTIFL